MNNNIIKENTIKAIAIEESISNMLEADEKMTQALMALEARNYGIAFRHAQDVLAASECIEQRLAALCIQYLAIPADKYKIEEALTIAYDTDHQLDPIAKCNKSFKQLGDKIDSSLKKLSESISKHFA